MSRRTNIFCCPTPLVADPNGLDGNGANVLRFDSLAPNNAPANANYDGHFSGVGFSALNIFEIYFPTALSSSSVFSVNSDTDLEFQLLANFLPPGVYPVSVLLTDATQIDTGLTLTLT